MKRPEAWRMQYRSDRYMRDLSDPELFERGGQLMTPLLEHSADGRIGLVSGGDDFTNLERWTHFLEELSVRGLDYRDPAIIQALHGPKPQSPKVMRALAVLSRNPCREDPILVKFGERRYMKSLLLEGRGRISLARTYKDPTLGKARSDDESQISTYVHPADAHRIMALEESPGGGTRGLDVDVPYLGSVRIQLAAVTDFYVYCLTQSCDPRMFDDFSTPDSNVDTCVVVTRPDVFRARIRRGIQAQLPGWTLLESEIHYFDPFFSRFHELTPHFSKSLQFQYQKEYRLLWLPPETASPTQTAFPEHVYFDLGPLTDCARLIWL